MPTDHQGQIVCRKNVAATEAPQQIVLRRPRPDALQSAQRFDRVLVGQVAYTMQIYLTVSNGIGKAARIDDLLPAKSALPQERIV